MKGNKLVITCECTNDQPPCFEVTVSIESPSLKSSNDLRKVYTVVVREGAVEVSRLARKRTIGSLGPAASSIQKAVTAVMLVTQEI